MNHFKYGTNRRLIKTFSILLLGLLLSACTGEQGRILKQADYVMESRPDSAMILLEGIDRSRLNESEHPYYALLYTQAQVKTDIPLDSDSLISLAYAQYGNDFKGDRGLRSNFYTGEVFFNQQRNPEAMRYFLTVYEESKRNSNDYWRAKAAERISDLFFFAYNYDEAEKYAQEAARLFERVNRQTFHRYTLAMLANIFLNNGKNSQAYFLLDSLQKVSLNEHPTDSAFLAYLRYSLIDAAVKTRNIDKLDSMNFNPIIEDKGQGISIDEGLTKSQYLIYEDNITKSKRALESIDTIGMSKDKRLHLLYALYKNAEDLGDKSTALSYVDSLLLLQSAIAEEVIKESVTGAQRDFYSSRAFQEEERNIYLRYLIITIVIAFVIAMALISIILYHKQKAYKMKSESDLEAIMSLKSASKSLSNENQLLQRSLNEKGILINELNGSIEASRCKVETLTKEIADKDSERGELQDVLNKKVEESLRLQSLLTQKNNEYENIQSILHDKIEKEVSQAEIIETLFREKWTTLDRLCGEYFSLNNSEISTNGLLESINKEVKRITSKKGVKEIVEAVDLYMGGIITLLRAQCKFLKENDINFIALVYAGFTVRAVCLFMQLEYQHFFVKKGRLIKRIQNSDAPDKDLFISKIR